MLRLSNQDYLEESHEASFKMRLEIRRKASKITKGTGPETQREKRDMGGNLANLGQLIPKLPNNHLKCRALTLNPNCAGKLNTPR